MITCTFPGPAKPFGSPLNRIPENHAPHHPPPPLPQGRRPKAPTGSSEGSPSPITPHPPHTPTHQSHLSRSSASPAPPTPTHTSHPRSVSSPSVLPHGSSYGLQSHAAITGVANIPPGDTYITAPRAQPRTAPDGGGERHAVPNKVSANHFRPIEEQEWYWGNISK